MFTTHKVSTHLLFKHLFATLLLFMAPLSAFAADKLDSGDTAWILTSTALVLFMTIPGLALFYAGLVRAKNVLSVLMQCFAITCMVSILWVIAGYSLALTEGGSFIGGTSKFFLEGVTRDSLNGTIPETLWVMFQMTFAIITPALIVGGFAERMKFSSMMLFSAIWLFVVYIPTCYWVWGGGWLSELGLIDYAGGTVVHVNAGIAALVAALYMGNRKGFPQTPMLPHNMTMTVTGAAMLWVGWFGFNAGSAVAAGGDAGMAMLVTHISAAAGSLAWMTMEWIRYKKPSVLGIVTGMVAGLGTITPASGNVGPLGALVIGLSAGIVCYYATTYLKQKLKVDDSLDVFPVHGVGGILGTMLVGVFAFSLGGTPPEGQTMMGQLEAQAIGVGATLLWGGVMTWVILKVVDILMGLRVDAEQEMEGLDHVLHEETGYNL